MISDTSVTPVDASAGLPPIRVLLADDHAVTLWGLCQLVESAKPRLSIAGTTNTCAGLLTHPALPQTDVVLLDLGLGDGNGINCVAQLVRETDAKVVLLTGDLNPSHHREAVVRGARGVVLKSEPTQNILDAIVQVHEGEVWFDRVLTNLLLTSLPGVLGKPAPSGNVAAQRVQTLTPRERQVIQALVGHRGAKNLVVAESLGMSEYTMRNHLSAIYEKLGVQRKLDLYAYAIEHRLGPLPVADRRKPAPSPLWGRTDSAWGTIP